tara:strand:+ start:1165 stop:1665 length:501 start_codon:yes stop_codon:yes gene_type:complete
MAKDINNKKEVRIEVRNIQDVQRRLKDLGKTARESRTAINKALRPAANMLARGIQSAYKEEFNKNSDYKRKSGRTPTWKTIGIITARKSRQPGLFVGPVVRKTTPIRVKGKDSRNLPAMQIKGNKIQNPRPNVFEATATKMNEKIYLQAESDLDKLVDKMIKQAGF